MDREGGNKEKMRECREWLSLHFLFIVSFSLHFLAPWIQGCCKLCNPATKCVRDVGAKICVCFPCSCLHLKFFPACEQASEALIGLTRASVGLVTIESSSIWNSFDRIQQSLLFRIILGSFKLKAQRLKKGGTDHCLTSSLEVELAKIE